MSQKTDRFSLGKQDSLTFVRWILNLMLQGNAHEVLRELY